MIRKQNAIMQTTFSERYTMIVDKIKEYKRL